MERLSNAAILGVGLLLLYYILSHWRENRLAHQDGCKPPVKYNHKDPIFGLDYAIGTHFNVPSIVTHHAKYGKTFQTSFMGSVHINTCDPRNIQAIVSTHNKEWGVEPLRFPGMEPFCGKGIITADGATWEHSRALLKTQFRTNNLVSFPTLDLCLEELFSHVPSDGSTVDLEPFFSTLVSQL